MKLQCFPRNLPPIGLCTRFIQLPLNKPMSLQDPQSGWVLISQPNAIVPFRAASKSLCPDHVV